MLQILQAEQLPTHTRAHRGKRRGGAMCMLLVWVCDYFLFCRIRKLRFASAMYKCSRYSRLNSSPLTRVHTEGRGGEGLCVCSWCGCVTTFCFVVSESCDSLARCTNAPDTPG